MRPPERLRGHLLETTVGESSNGISSGITNRSNGLIVPDSALADAYNSAYTLITSRQNISPKRLDEPGPSQQALEQIFRAAAAAPALIDRDPGATLEQIESAREKAYRAPCLILVVARLGSCEPPIPQLERMVSVGCAVQNMLLMAHSQSFGSSLTSGQAMHSPRMRKLFDLADGEEAVCFLNIGTVKKRKAQRLHPSPDEFVSSL